MKTLTSLFLALLLALTMAACGGGGGDSEPPPPPPITDTDGDGVNDDQDAFPNDPNEWADSDGDGVGDNADACPNDPDGYLDTDGDGICDYADPPQTPFTSGTPTYGNAPAPTGSQFPEIATISYGNVVTPGSIFKFQISVNGSAADIAEVFITESGVADHTVFDASLAISLTNDFITFEATLSEDLTTEENLELEIGVKDYNGNVSEYHHVSIQLSADEQFSVTSYSGDSEFDLIGSWKIVETAEEGGPYGGTTWTRQVMITQSENDLIITGMWYSFNGIITGNNNFVTLTSEGTNSLKPWDGDYHTDVWNTLSGEVINNDRIKGKGNLIVKRTYGEDTNGVKDPSYRFDLVMTRGFSPEDDHGNEIANASFVPFNTDVKGELEASEDIDVFGFWALNGKSYIIELSLSSLSDGEIKLYDKFGSLLSVDASNITLVCDSSCNNDYYIKIESTSGATGTYTIKVQENN